EIDFRRPFITPVVTNVFAPVEVHVTKGRFAELAHRMGLSRGEDESVAVILLQHAPHPFDEFRRVAPVALGLQIAEEKLVLESVLNRRGRARDLARDKRFATARALMVEENSIARPEAVALAVVHGGPIGEDF